MKRVWIIVLVGLGLVLAVGSVLTALSLSWLAANEGFTAPDPDAIRIVGVRYDVDCDRCMVIGTPDGMATYAGDPSVGNGSVIGGEDGDSIGEGAGMGEGDGDGDGDQSEAASDETGGLLDPVIVRLTETTRYDSHEPFPVGEAVTADLAPTANDDGSYDALFVGHGEVRSGGF